MDVLQDSSVVVEGLLSCVLEQDAHVLWQCVSNKHSLKASGSPTATVGDVSHLAARNNGSLRILYYFGACQRRWFRSRN